MSELISKWGQGREEIQALLDDGKLQKVAPSREHAERLIRQSLNHLKSSEDLAQGDPEGAYSLLYDAARKAFVGVLEVQGLRPTSKGGHVVIYEALKAQIDPPLGAIVATFNRLRRSRNNSEYPRISEPDLNVADLTEDLKKSREIVDVAKKLIENFPVY